VRVLVAVVIPETSQQYLEHVILKVLLKKSLLRFPYQGFWIRMVIGRSVKSGHAPPCKDQTQTQGSR
jgi:hypothetical protein